MSLPLVVLPPIAITTPTAKVDPRLALAASSATLCKISVPWPRFLYFGLSAFRCPACKQTVLLPLPLVVKRQLRILLDSYLECVSCQKKTCRQTQAFCRGMGSPVSMLLGKYKGRHKPSRNFGVCVCVVCFCACVCVCVSASVCVCEAV